MRRHPVQRQGRVQDGPLRRRRQLKWDRRVYVLHKVEPGCVDKPDLGCAFGKRVMPSSVQEGVLTACADGEMVVCPGYCMGAEIQVPFTIDTTGTEGTIEVK